MRPSSVLLGALLLAGCRGPGRAPVDDLSVLSVVADHKATWTLVLFGTPGAQPLEERGFVRAEAPAPGQVRSWVEPRTRIDLVWDQARPRMAMVEMAPHPDLGRLSAEVSLNGTRVGSLRLRSERGWYRIDLPAETQHPGSNQLELRFSDGTAPVKPHRRRLSAELYALAVGDPAGGDGPAAPGPAEEPLRRILQGANVMLVVLDAARAGDFGCYGYPRDTTPEIDRWASVLVTADHGEALYEHGHVGHIRQLYRESIWIPLIVRFPRGSRLEGRRIHGMVSLIDLAPTIADLLGLPERNRARQ